MLEAFRIQILKAHAKVMAGFIWTLIYIILGSCLCISASQVVLNAHEPHVFFLNPEVGFHSMPRSSSINDALLRLLRPLRGWQLWPNGWLQWTTLKGTPGWDRAGMHRKGYCILRVGSGSDTGVVQNKFKIFNLDIRLIIRFQVSLVKNAVCFK